MTGKTTEDEIGDAILDTHGVEIDDDPPAVEKSPVSDSKALGAREVSDDADDSKGSGGKSKGTTADDDKTGSKGTDDDDESLLAGKYKMDAEGITSLEKDAVTSIQHQSERDKAEAALLNQGYVKDDEGNWVAPSDRVESRSKALPVRKFDPGQLARKLVGTDDSDDDSIPRIDVPDDFDANDPNQLVGMIGKVVGGVMKTERSANQRVADVEAQLIELQQTFPDITTEEIEETIQYLQAGGLSLASAHAIRTGGLPKDQRRISGEESVAERKENARTAAALEEFRQTRDKRRPAPGTSSAGGAAAVTDDKDKSEADEIGDQVVTTGINARRRRI